MYDTLHVMKALLEKYQREAVVRNLVIMELYFNGAFALSRDALLQSIRPRYGRRLETRQLKEFKHALMRVLDWGFRSPYGHFPDVIKAVRFLETRFDSEFGVEYINCRAARRFRLVSDYLQEVWTMIENVFDYEPVKRGSSKTRRDLLKQAVLERFKRHRTEKQTSASVF